MKISIGYKRLGYPYSYGDELNPKISQIKKKGEKYSPFFYRFILYLTKLRLSQFLVLMALYLIGIIHTVTSVQIIFQNIEYYHKLREFMVIITTILIRSAPWILRSIKDNYRRNLKMQKPSVCQVISITLTVNYFKKN